MTELERKVQVLDPEPAAKQQDQSSEAESNSNEQDSPKINSNTAVENFVSIEGMNDTEIHFEVKEKTITIFNESSDHIMYKILLVLHSHYHFDPSSGKIAPGEKQQVSMRLKKNLPHKSSKQNNKFQFKVVRLPKDADQTLSNLELFKKYSRDSDAEIFSPQYQVVYTPPVDLEMKYNSEKINILKASKNNLEKKLNDLLSENQDLQSQLQNLNLKLEESEVKAQQIQARLEENGVEHETNAGSVPSGDVSMIDVIKSAVNQEANSQATLGQQILLIFVIGILLGYFASR